MCIREERNIKKLISIASIIAGIVLMVYNFFCGSDSILSYIDDFFNFNIFSVEIWSFVLGFILVCIGGAGLIDK